MLALHPNILEKNGIQEFAVLPYSEFLKVKEQLQDFEDLKDLRQAKLAEKNVEGMSLSDAEKEWGLKV
ncbi:MAG: type II toxin-antitoxin system Phd/YefM family antitoxin [Gammaproteobacteria bacterium]|nr:MAG: type II toxin-antitoxin system Phd/YefM family antitoxin [Gammaproteobacteria bacterium]